MRGLKAKVEAILRRHDNGAADRWSRSNAKDTLPDVCNYWRFALAQVKVENTIDARTYLDPNMAPDQWLRYFEIVVVPIVVRNQLPVEC